MWKLLLFIFNYLLILNDWSIQCKVDMEKIQSDFNWIKFLSLKLSSENNFFLRIIILIFIATAEKDVISVQTMFPFSKYIILRCISFLNNGIHYFYAEIILNRRRSFYDPKWCNVMEEKCFFENENDISFAYALSFMDH